MHIILDSGSKAGMTRKNDFSERTHCLKIKLSRILNTRDLPHRSRYLPFISTNLHFYWIKACKPNITSEIIAVIDHSKTY